MGILLVFILLPIAFIFYVAFKLLKDSRLVVSSSREITRKVARILGLSYLIVGIIISTQFIYYGDHISESMNRSVLLGGFLLILTIISIFFSKSR
jgi:hypothetical protein